MPVTIIPFQFPGVPNVGCAFTGRGFGNISLDLAARDQAPTAWADTVRARESIPAVLGVDAFAEVHQVHGVRTIFEPEAQSPTAPSVTDADGLATTRRGLALMIKTADCQPILIAHGSGRYVMGLHSGWKGNQQDYPYVAVQEFCQRYSLDPAELWAVRGPSLGPAASEFTNFASEWGQGFSRWFDTEKRTMNLWMLARDQLVRAGLLPSRVLGLDICTFDNAENFFSYRQFRKHSVPDGRQASFIWIR
ncbi:MAG: polyphenol oxidase family protein [Mailhella sp.]|nr:polyphenol oxidase family protein [Mailhella sp.]